MKTKAISASVIGVLLCLAVVIMRERAVQRVPAAQNLPDPASAGGGQHVTSNQTTERDRSATGARDVNFALAARLETLERAVMRLDRTRELDELRTRVAELERSMRNSQQAMTTPVSRSKASDVSQLEQELKSLKRAHAQLAAKVASAKNQTYPARNDLRVLQQKVFSLENTVQRLQSR